MALGPHAGAWVRRVGREPDVEATTSRGPRQAHLDGFDLHANVWVSANDRAGRLCRYVLRPPFAQEHLRLRGDRRVAVKLKMPWRDGTTELVFEPLEFLGKLAAITPRPKVNLIICHGLLAPHARSRRCVVAYGRIAPDPTGSAHIAAALAPVSDGAEAPRRPRYWTWAALMQRAFAIDVLTCPRCGSRLRLIATVHDPGVIRRIRAPLGLSRSGQSPGSAPAQQRRTLRISRSRRGSNR